ncbi:hypothetical protein [Bradyrhizobium japonicum]|uniref:hypothetical protein n=1 Tax=Bradyrhizobium japonicum TaxID=375 RepID=UPI00040B285D|nr:hypothetical protein [Bradyrhizobium japonicum]MCP1741717.1 hypothetical protein [Bradyrhizobium japonicum]MCP1779459.1 hypothetical protein [Bradyrhizobium japonicum]MCP1859427.1 hypothetical protein [Bradyrhizobium japonicum]MCP1890194.1 hypothetical protein [Bradyrhizobium japonicum]MCP1957546.1 hypothetical protein [Bradyrhizobium japonicum]
MPRISTFAKDLQLATAGIAPENIGKELAAFARSELANAIQEGEGSERYERYVNGRLGAQEETVVPPGPILYVFHWWREIVEFALQTAVERSPEKSGDYKKSWFIMTPGGVVKSFDDIPINSTVVLTNNRPYARKIDVGHVRMTVPPGIVEDVRKAVMARFGNFVIAKRTMIPLPGGYVLKGRFRRGYRPFARTKLRSDTMAGAQMTYPALVLSMKVL